MRRPPTVQEGRCYLTLELDTACENTVVGKTLLQEITTRLVRLYSVKPLIEAEHEAYCFGPGQPITSNERWAVPFLIQGEPGVIKTSSIADDEGSRIR